MSSAPAVAAQHDLLRVENHRLAQENDQLTDHVDQLAARNSALDTELQELTRKLERYEEQLAWFKNRLYGRSTEQLSDAERLLFHSASPGTVLH